ncbi:DUF805 domain-containing protein [SAR202 cluster bacterium AC-647-N09_OGT_505m]|nr:DUF805 domain-containing protein [SAR202 cluster bacterium AC-647-N09_OGT_505m]
MNCPTCGSENPEDAQSCDRCGAYLNAPTVNGIGIAVTELPMVNFPQAIKLGFKNYFEFSGRATRAEFWWWALLVTLGGLIPLLGWIVRIALLIPSISLTTRRLHDIGKSGWQQLWALLALSPWVFIVLVAVVVGDTIVYTLVSLFFYLIIAFAISIGLASMFIDWLVRKGETGANKYGPDPREPTSHHPHNPQ